MDIITLAAAKAYTDKKCAESGGSGGGSGYTLPVVELTTKPLPQEYGGAELTAEESAKMDALNGMPCILLCTVNTGTMDIPFKIVASSFFYPYDNSFHYTAVSGLGSLMAEQDSGKWKFTVIPAQ